MENIKKIIKRLFFTDFINYKHDYNSELAVQKNSKVYVRSCGELNQDKLFYVIRRNGGGAGFFSNFVHVLSHIKIADNLNMIPVVDFENFKTYYNESNLINGKKNAWEYYFSQPTQYSLDEVYKSKHVFYSDGDFPWDIWQGQLRDKNNYKLVYDKYIKILPDILDSVRVYNHFFDTNVLGVHFRGKEMNHAINHPFGATVEQMFHYTDMMLEKYSLEKIFLLTEEKDYQKLFIQRYGNKVLLTNSFCIARVNAYNVYPRKNHKYLLGFEILRDAILLSKCSFMLCSESNVSEFARMIGNHKAVYRIDNGFNSKNRIIARYLYFIKKRLPSWCGGLKNNIKIF